MLRSLQPRQLGLAVRIGRLVLAATALAVSLAWLAAGPASADTASHLRETLSAAVSGPRAAVLQLGAGYGPTGSRSVRELQHLLSTAGYSPGPADGRYGLMTQAAVERYQADHGLRVDGIAGPETVAALAAHSVLLRPGAGYTLGSSPAVRHLQLWLVRAGYSPGAVDGLFGPRTEAAVRRFQAHDRLPVTGVVAGSTLAAVRSSSSHRVPAASPSNRPARSGPASRKPVPSVPSAPPHSTPARPAPVHSAPAPVGRRAPAPRAGHPAGGTPAPWLWLVAVLLIALLVGAPLYLYRRHSAKTGDITDVSPDGAGVLESEAVAAADPAPAPSEAVAADDSIPVPVADEPIPAPAAADAAPSEAPAPAPADGERETLTSAELFERGALLQAHGDMRGAEAAYRSADEQGHPGAASNLGVLLEQRGDLLGAEEAYRRADQRGEANGAFNLGVLLEEREDLAAAESAYRRADQRGHPAAASNLGVLLEGRDDRTEAEAAYRRAAERGEPNGAFNLGVLLEEHGDFAGAEAAYRRAESGSDPRVSRLARGALLDLIPGIADAGPAPAGGGADGS